MFLLTLENYCCCLLLTSSVKTNSYSTCHYIYCTKILKSWHNQWRMLSVSPSLVLPCPLPAHFKRSVLRSISILFSFWWSDNSICVNIPIVDFGCKNTYMTVAGYERMERHSFEETPDKHKPRVFWQAILKKKITPTVYRHNSCPGHVELVWLNGKHD